MKENYISLALTEITVPNTFKLQETNKAAKRKKSGCSGNLRLLAPKIRFLYLAGAGGRTSRAGAGRRVAHAPPTLSPAGLQPLEGLVGRLPRQPCLHSPHAAGAFPVPALGVRCPPRRRVRRSNRFLAIGGRVGPAALHLGMRTPKKYSSNTARGAWMRLEGDKWAV